MLTFHLSIDTDDDLIVNTPRGPIQSFQLFVIERETESEVRRVVRQFLRGCAAVKLPHHTEEKWAVEFSFVLKDFIQQLGKPITAYGDPSAPYFMTVGSGGNRCISLKHIVEDDYIHI